MNAIGRKQDIILGLIPCGKGNDLASALRIPKNPIQAIEVLLAQQTRQTDLGKIGDKFFHTIATCGYDAEVGRRVTEEGSILPGTLAYTQKAITTLPKFERLRLKKQNKRTQCPSSVLVHHINVLHTNK